MEIFKEKFLQKPFPGGKGKFHKCVFSPGPHYTTKDNNMVPHSTKPWILLTVEYHVEYGYLYEVFDIESGKSYGRNYDFGTVYLTNTLIESKLADGCWKFANGLDRAKCAAGELKDDDIS